MKIKTFDDLAEAIRLLLNEKITIYKYIDDELDWTYCFKFKTDFCNEYEIRLDCNKDYGLSVITGTTNGKKEIFNHFGLNKNPQLLYDVVKALYEFSSLTNK